MPYPFDRHRNGKLIIDSPPANRKCSTCKIVKPFPDGFYRDNNRDVLRGYSYRCKECSRAFRKLHTRTNHGRFIHAKQIAKRNGRVFTLTEAEYLDLRSKPCTYCGDSLPETGLGLDRIDNEVGYMLGNVAPCCTVCNTVKANIFTHDEMLLLGSVVSQIRMHRKTPLVRPNLGHRRIPD